MTKNILFKLILNIAVFCLFFNCAVAKESTFVSISPSMTEIMYAIGAKNQLYAVSNTCTYPDDVKNKEKIGSGYLLNEEKILKIKPDYILAFDSSSAQLEKFKKFGITPLCFKYSTIEAILDNIKKIGQLTNKEQQAEKLIKEIDHKIKKANLHHNKKILFVVQTSPMITIGNKSFITDVIKKSGNYSIGSELKISYPVISEEYAIKQKPDVIVLSPYADENKIKTFFPDTKTVKLTPELNDIISRPGPRVYKAVEFFSKL